jgi:hypothetical protein
MASGLSDGEFYAPYPGLMEGARSDELLAIALRCMTRDPTHRPLCRQAGQLLRQFCDALHPAAAAAAASANAAALAAAEAGRRSAPQEVMPDGTPYGELMRELVSLRYEEVITRLLGLKMEAWKRKCILEHMCRLRTPLQMEQWRQEMREWKERKQEEERRREEEEHLQMWLAMQQQQQQQQWIAMQDQQQQQWGEQPEVALLVPEGWSADWLLQVISHLESLPADQRVSCLAEHNLSPPDLAIIQRWLATWTGWLSRGRWRCSPARRLLLRGTLSCWLPVKMMFSAWSCSCNIAPRSKSGQLQALEKLPSCRLPR